MKIKQRTVAEKVNELLINQHAESDGSSEETTDPRVTEVDDEDYELPQSQSTEFRKRNVKLLWEESAKYKGKISTRKELEQENEATASDNETVESALESADEDMKAFAKKLKEHAKQKPFNESNDLDSEEEEEDDESDEDVKVFDKKHKEAHAEQKSFNESNDLGSEEDDDNEDNESEDDMDDEFDQSEDDMDDEFDQSEDEDKEKEQQIVRERNHESELQKGICVQNQLRIWEKLLEIRIQSQKILVKANKLPSVEKTQTLDTKEMETVQNVGNLLHKLIDLQQTLSEQYSELHEETKCNRKRINNFTAIIEEPACKRLGVELENQFQTFRTYRNNVLLKWDDRTKLMTPGAGIKRKTGQEDFDILKKITHALNNRQALIKGSHCVADKTSDVGECTQIYDDSDFYHQQLRELIEYKANTTSNMAEVTKQYVELQKLRHKMKKKVDTRASKGRKIRYGVHKKLVNFMAPEELTSWTEQTKDELYKSLFA